MLRADELLGVIMIYRHEVRPFSDSQVALMETFADQAAIAIENTRLFEQVQARNRDLIALGEVGRAVSSTLDLKVVLKTIVGRAVDLSGTDAGPSSTITQKPEGSSSARPRAWTTSWSRDFAPSTSRPDRRGSARQSPIASRFSCPM